MTEGKLLVTFERGDEIAQHVGCACQAQAIEFTPDGAAHIAFEARKPRYHHQGLGPVLEPVLHLIPPAPCGPVHEVPGAVRIDRLPGVAIAP